MLYEADPTTPTDPTAPPPPDPNAQPPAGGAGAPPPPPAADAGTPPPPPDLGGPPPTTGNVPTGAGPQANVKSVFDVKDIQEILKSGRQTIDSMKKNIPNYTPPNDWKLTDGKDKLVVNDGNAMRHLITTINNDPNVKPEDIISFADVFDLQKSHLQSNDADALTNKFKNSGATQEQINDWEKVKPTNTTQQATQTQTNAPLVRSRKYNGNIIMENQQLNEWKRLSGLLTESEIEESNDHKKASCDECEKEVKFGLKKCPKCKDNLCKKCMTSHECSLQERSMPHFGDMATDSQTVSSDVFDREANEDDTFVIDPEHDTPKHKILTKVGYLDSIEDGDADEDIDDIHMISMDDDEPESKHLIDHYDDYDLEDTDDEYEIEDNSDEDFLEEPFLPNGEVYKSLAVDPDIETEEDWEELEDEDKTDVFEDSDVLYDDDMEESTDLNMSGTNIPMGEDNVGFVESNGMINRRRNYNLPESKRIKRHKNINESKLPRMTKNQYIKKLIKEVLNEYGR